VDVLPPNGQEKLLQGAGYSEDQIFEIAVCAALGPSMDRLTAGLGATSVKWDLQLPCPSEALAGGYQPRE
jgi:hypothetical protein